MTDRALPTLRAIDGGKAGRGPVTEAEVRKREHDIEVARQYRAYRVVERLQRELERDIRLYGRQVRRPGFSRPPFDGGSAA
jgi:hypothetical protein